jgi:O-antigen/teichoic acid export membrane protein
MSRSGRAARGFATAILQYFSQILVQILLAPLVLRMAGRETLGAYAAIMQTLGLLALIDIAGTWSLERFLGQAVGAEDHGARFRTVFTSARTLLILTNTVFATLAVIFSLFIGRLFHLTPGITAEARHALFVIAGWAILRTPLAAYSSALVASQDMASVNLIGTLLGIGRTAASLLFVLAGSGLFGLMLAGTVVEACGTILYRVRFKKLHPDRMPGWGIPDRALLKEMLGFGGYAMFQNIGNRLFFSSANILAGLTSGAAVASTFYTSQMPAMTGYYMLYKLTENSAPAIYELHGRNNIDKLRGVFIRLLRLTLLMTVGLAAGVFLFNRDLVVTWVGNQQYAGSLLTDTLALYVLVNAVQGIAILFSFVFGWVRLLAVTALLQGGANFGLGYYLGKKLGLGGITLALVVVLLPQLIILLRKLNVTLQVNSAALLVRFALRAIIPIAAASAAGLFVHSLVTIRRHHFSGFLAESLAFVLVYAIAAYFLIMTRQDHGDVQRYLSILLNKRKSLQARVFGAA